MYIATRRARLEAREAGFLVYYNSMIAFGQKIQRNIFSIACQYAVH